MEIKTIGYGRGSVHDFESSDFREYCYMEATLEPWEDAEESLKILRDKVFSKVGIKEDVEALEHERNALKKEIQQYEDIAIKARSKWKKLKEFSQKIEEIETLKDFDPIPF